MYKRNLRKIKTDKLDCISLSELNSNLKNRYKNLVYLCFPEYELLFKKQAIYSDIALSFISKYPHAEIISNTRIDCLQNFFKQSKYSR